MKKIKGYIFADHKYILFYDDNVDINKFFEIYDNYVTSYSQLYDEITFELSND